MVDVEQNERATALAAQALRCLTNGQIEEASRALREAVSLEPGNTQVNEALHRLQNDEAQHVLLKLCNRFAGNGDVEAGNTALRYLARSAEVPAEVARECSQLMTNVYPEQNPDTRDAIYAGLFRESTAAKTLLAKQLQEGVAGSGITSLFERLYNLGDGAAGCVTAVVLDASAWATETSREACEKDVFQLFLAKLVEVGDEQDGRALESISRLLVADAARLHTLIDEEMFDIILTTLDYRRPAQIRSQATLTAAKYLEASQERGQKTLAKFVTSRIAQQKNQDLILAFSAAAAIFPVAPPVAASLFLVESFISSLMPLLEQKAKSEKVTLAALEMLSAACIDSNCREAINKHCLKWLQLFLQSKEGPEKGLAAVILAKLSGPSGDSKIKEARGDFEMDKLVDRLLTMVTDDSSADRQGSMEGLAYVSVQPEVKKQLAEDSAFLHSLLLQLQGSKHTQSLAFGCLTIINNLTRYPPNLTEEQKKMSQLKAYANASGRKPEGPALLDQESAVGQRCEALVAAGVVPALVTVGKSLSQGSIALVFDILLSLGWPQGHRGRIAQQGGVKVLLQLYTKITGNGASEKKARRVAAQAVARILISVNPTLVFPASGTPSMTAAVRPIISLITEDPSLPSEGPHDLLPTFEALLALANLVVDPYGEASNSACDLIIRLAGSSIDDLILNDNARIRRATTQLVTNLVQHPTGIAFFADESDSAARRLHILLALSGSDDLETRKAAGGALAILTEFEGTVNTILKMERGMELLLAMLDDEEHEMLHRGIVALANAASLEGAVGQQARTKMKSLDALELIKAIIECSKSDEILGIAAQVYKMLDR